MSQKNGLLAWYPLQTVSEEKGLPIGNLTSQFFANYYLSALDHFVLEKINPKGYVRYMDDFLLFCDSKEILLKMFCQIEDYCNKELLLTLKPFVLGKCKGVWVGVKKTHGNIATVFPDSNQSDNKKRR